MFKVTHHHEIRFGPLDFASEATPNFSKQGLARVSLWPRAMLWVPFPAAQCSNLSSHRIGFLNQLQLQLTFLLSSTHPTYKWTYKTRQTGTQKKKNYQTAKQLRPAVFVSWQLNKIKPKEFRMRVCTRARRTEKSRDFKDDLRFQLSWTQTVHLFRNILCSCSCLEVAKWWVTLNLIKHNFPKLHCHYSSVTNSTGDHSSEDEEVMWKPKGD